MTEPEVTTSEPDEEKPASSAKVWLERIGEYRTKMAKWDDQCKNLDKVYSRDDRSDAADREYAIFWSNLEVLAPAVYARPPVPVVAPRFKDGNPVAREASETLERCLIVQHEAGELDELMDSGITPEFLRYGRATAWVRLAGNDDALAYDLIGRNDFAHELARNWREVKWVARRDWFTREEGSKRFDAIFSKVPQKKRDDPSGGLADKDSKFPVWQIWSKTEGCVYWVAEEFDELLDHKTPEELGVNLDGFWPCPKPAYGTLVPDTLRPVPEIRQYKDQIEEINEYTARISALSESLRVRGFYPAGAGDLSTAIESALKITDNRAVLVPISSFAALGGS